MTFYFKNYTIPYTAKLVDPITGIQLPDETGVMTVKNVFYVEAEVKDGRIETKRKKQNKVKIH